MKRRRTVVVRRRRFRRAVASFAILGLSVVGCAGPADPPNIIVVNSTLDRAADDGLCTLREAIVAANRDTPSGTVKGECLAGDGDDEIHFNLHGRGGFEVDGLRGFRLRPRSPLPQVTGTVDIDGYSQPGARTNQAPAPGPLDGRLLVELDGSRAGRADGLQFASGSDRSRVRGLVISGFTRGNAIALSSRGVIVTGNYIGTDLSGSLPQPNRVGLVSTPSGSGRDARIGGSRAEDRNLVSGNTAGQGATAGYPGSGWVIQGNYVGVAADGLTALPNGTVGGSGSFSIDDCEDVTVGGPQPQAANVIGSSLGHGLAPFNVDRIRIQGNYIGVGYDGTTKLGNLAVGVGSGISLVSARGAVIADNRIAGWRSDGIFIGEDATHPARRSRDLVIERNRVFENGQAGIATSGVGGLVLRKNMVSANGGDGISATQSADLSLIGNLVGHNIGAGIGVRASEGVRLSAGRVFDSGGDGVAFSDDAGVRVADVAISGSGADGLSISGGSNVRVAAVAIAGNGDDGLSASDTKDLRIRNAEIRASGRNGVAVVRTREVDVRTSSIDQSGRTGVDLVVASNVTMFKNKVRQTEGPALRIVGGATTGAGSSNIRVIANLLSAESDPLARPGSRSPVVLLGDPSDVMIGGEANEDENQIRSLDGGGISVLELEIAALGATLIPSSISILGNSFEKVGAASGGAVSALPIDWMAGVDDTTPPDGDPDRVSGSGPGSGGSPQRAGYTPSPVVTKARSVGSRVQISIDPAPGGSEPRDVLSRVEVFLGRCDGKGSWTGTLRRVSVVPNVRGSAVRSLALPRGLDPLEACVAATVTPERGGASGAAPTSEMSPFVTPSR